MKKNIHVIAVVVYIVVAAFAILISTRQIFNRETLSTLSQAARIKELEFFSNLDGELRLATKMAKSPLISRYMQNPSDQELFSLAMEEIKSYEQAFKSKSSFSIADADLLYYSDCKYLYTLDKSDPANSWFDSCLALKEDYTFMVSYDIALKKSMLWVDAIVRDGAGRGIGLAGTGVDLSDFVDMMYGNLQPGITMYFYNQDSEITGATDTKLLEDKVPITEKLPGIANLERFPQETQFHTAGEGIYALTPIPSVAWTMALFVPYTTGAFFAHALLPAVIAVLGFAVLMTVIIMRRFMMPLHLIQQTISDIAEGNADLTRRIVSSKGSLRIVTEIGNGFNSFIMKLQEIIITVKDSKGRLFDSAEELRGCIMNTASSVSQIDAHIGDMDSNIGEQTASVSQTASAVNQISANIESLNKMILTQTQSVSDASAAVEEMLGNINSVDNSISRLSSSFGLLEESTNTSVSKQDEVNSRIEEIKNQSEMLQDANLTISSIAEQTNLLAMNAAIEAAHAGEAGKGFSVVADEIRKLSETSSEQSQTISRQLGTIQSSISEIADVSHVSQESLRSVAQNINDTNVLVQQIAEAMDEQKEGSRQIMLALSALKDNSAEVKSASEEMAAGNKSILKEMQNLQDSSQSMKDRMSEMSGDAKTITRASETLKELAGQMDNSISKISGEIDLFHV